MERFGRNMKFFIENLTFGPYSLFGFPQCLIECQVQFENIDPRLSQNPELPSLGVLANELSHVVLLHSAFPGNAWDLKLCCCRADMWVEARS